MGISLTISCEKAALLVAEREERKLSFMEQMQLALHLSVCEACKLYEKQFIYITKQTQHFISSAELSLEDKAHLVQLLQN